MFRYSCFIVLLLLTWGMESRLIAQDKMALREIDGDEGTFAWIVQESTGRIFASVATSDVVNEYSGTGARVRQFRVGGEPSELLIKNNRLVVGCQESTTFYVIDLEKNEVAGSASLAGKGPYGLFCSQAENPFVYGVCNTGSAWRDGEIFQVDINKVAVNKRVKVQGWGQSHPIHVAMSRDGKWIVPDARGSTSPSGADLMSVDEQECSFRQIRDHHQSFGQMIAGPANRYWTFGNLLYPLDITASVRKFTGSPVAIHPELNLAVSFRSPDLYFETFSDAKLLKTVTLGSVEADKRAKRPRADPKLLFDLKNDRVVIGYQSKAWIVDLNRIGIEYQSMLMIQAPSSVSVKVGTTLRLPLSVTNEDLRAKTTFSIESGPETAKVTGGELVWTPTDSEVGQHEVLVRATSGDLKDSLRIQLSVDLPKVEFNFATRAMSIAPDGKFMAVWGPKIPTDARQSVSISRGGPEEFALIDLERMQLKAQRNLTTGTRAAMLGDKYLYLAPNTGNVMYRLNREEMSDSRRVFLNAPVQSFVKLDGNRFGVIMLVNSQPSMVVYDRETLDKIETAPAQRSSYPGQTSGYLQLTGTYFQVNQSVFDAKTGNFVCSLGRVSTLPMLATSTARTNVVNLSFHHSSNKPAKLWGRYLMNGTILNYLGTRITNWQSNATRVSHVWPVAISIRAESQGRTTKSYLELRELIGGEVVHSSVIDVASAQRSGYQRGSSLLEVVGSRVIYVKGNKVMLATIPREVVDKVNPPLHFQLPTSTIHPVDRPIKIKLEAKGGSGSRGYHLVAEYPGLELDESTGELTIDAPVLWKSFTTSVTAKLTDFRDRGNFARQLTNNAQSYETLVGKPLPEGKLATSLPIHVAVADDEGQEDRLEFHLIALGDRSLVDKAIKLREKEQAEAQEKARLAALERQKQMEAERTARAAEQAAGKGNSDRIQQLELRIRRIEATLDSILTKLDKLDKKD